MENMHLFGSYYIGKFFTLHAPKACGEVRYLNLDRLH